MTESRATLLSRVPGILLWITLAMGLLLNIAAEAAVAFRGATAVTVAGSGELDISKPAGVMIGDVMIAAIITKDIPPITPPAGWTLVRRTENEAKMALAVYYKIADAGEPASYTWIAAGGTNLGVGIQAYSGVDNTTPVDVEYGQSTPKGTMHATPSVTTTVANTMLVATHAAKVGNATWTPPEGMAERDEVSDPNVSMESSDVLQPAAGATGAKTATLSKASRDSATHILALKPAIAGADLNLTMSDSPDPVTVGGAFRYTLTATNNGPVDATNVTVVDTLPATVEWQSATPGQGSCVHSGEPLGGTITCTLGTVRKNADATVSIDVVAPSTTGVINNSATVSADEPDPDVSDNTATQDTTVIDPSANLSVTQDEDIDPAGSNLPFVYTVTVTNSGSADATLVTLVDTLDAAVTFQTAVPSQGSCAEAGGIVTCDLGGLANGSIATIDITVTAPGTPQTVTNTVVVSAAEPDSDPGDNTWVEDTVVVDQQPADLRLGMSDSPDPVLVNQAISYSLIIDNLGPDDATDVVLLDTLPAAVTFQSAISSQGSCSESGGTVTCNLGMIANAANATVDVIVTAPPSAGSISNNAVVSTSANDSNAANDSTSETTTVQNLNVNQLCYLVADAGGGGGGNDLLTQIDTADFDPLTNETNIGIGTGTNTIEAIAWNSATGVLYGANAGRLGTLSTTTGVFTALPSSFGTGSGALGNISFTDVDGLAYDTAAGVLYGVERQSGTDVLIQINMATGAHVPNAFGAGLDYVPMPPISGNSLTDDIAVDPTTGIMYAAVNAGGSTDRLIRVNKTTGATTDVALITVPDIEGLGTDPSGQLWGTSGTQGILYELNKVTGVGSNGRPINNGSDYESIDCHALSPSVIADLGVSKTVDDAAPPEGDTVTYTVTVTNTGPSTATVVQLSDSLPAGVTFVSASPGQGTYDSTTGAWFVGTLGVGSNATLTLQASVDAATSGTTITNTAGVTYLSQYDPNAGNTSASVDITPVTANLTVIKSVVTVRDPLGATTPAALAIPGAVAEYEIAITNSGNGAAGEVIVTDTLDANLTFLAGDFDGGAADVQINVGAAPPVYCIAEVGGDANADGCFLNVAGDYLTVTIPVSATYPTGLTVGTTAPDNVAVVHFRVTVN